MLLEGKRVKLRLFVLHNTCHVSAHRRPRGVAAVVCAVRGELGVVIFLKVPCHASAPNQPRVGDAEERVGAPSTLSTLSTLSYPRTHCGSCTYTLCTTAAPTFHACEWTPLRSQCVSAAQPDARHANAITRAADVPTRSRSHGIGGPVQPCGFALRTCSPFVCGTDPVRFRGFDR